MSIFIFFWYFEARKKCLNQSIIIISYLYVTMDIFIDYSDMDKMMDIKMTNDNNELESIK